MYNLEIEKINNGYILLWQEETEEGIFRTKKEIIEDSNDDDKETMTRLLFRISEYFGLWHDKYSEENLNIKWNKKGSKIAF